MSNNYSLELDGVDDEVITQVFPNLQDFSATVYFKTNLQSFLKRIMDLDDASPFYWDLNVHPSGILMGQIRINNINTDILGQTIVADNNWHFGAYVRKNDTCYLYVDGQLEGQTYAAPDLFIQSNPLVIGHTALNAYPEQHFDGNIDQVGFWNTALSQEQIQQYMNCPPTGNEAGLVGYWNFEEGTGTTATDLTSNGNNGTLVNGPIWSTDVPNQVCISCTASDTVMVNELLPTTSSITEANCDTYTAPDGTVYTTTGNYTAVIPNAAGCDSTINIDLTITNSNTGSESVTECDSYTWVTNGQTYTQSGQYTEVLTNQVGCDSTVTLNLTITNSNTGSETVTECNSYTWSTNGQTYTQSGQYTEVLTNQSGCDSTVTLNLTITNSNTGSETVTECNSYTWNTNGQTYTQSGQYTEVLTNQVGCDSTVTLNLTITNSNTGSETVTECDSYTWNTSGQTYTQSGQYTSVLTNQSGCDSTVTLNLTITNSNTGSETITECDSYTWNTNGQTYTQSGQYTEVLTNQVGCDSTVTLNLTITNSNTSSETVTECNSYTWNTNGQTYTQSGQYTEVLTNQSGCYSTVTLNLTINSSSSSTQTDTGLDSYTWSVNNQTYTQSGTYTAVIPNTSGCDSTITLDLTLQFTGLDENESSYVAVYPNPTYSSFTLSTKDMINMNYTLVDIQGKVVLTGKIESTEETVDISKLSKGQYNLVFEDESISPISIIKN